MLSSYRRMRMIILLFLLGVSLLQVVEVASEEVDVEVNVEVEVPANEVREVEEMIAQAKRSLGEEDYAVAADVLLSVLEVSPEHENANALLGSSYLALERPDLAEGFLYTALKSSNFSNVPVANNLAEALRLNGDLDLAVQLVENTIRAINQTDTSGLLEHQMGRLHEDKQNYDIAKQWYLMAALLQPKNVLFWIKATTLGFSEEAVDLKIAENVLAQGLTEVPSHPELLFQLGIVMQQSNRLDEACTLYRETLRQLPNHLGASINLGTALHSLRRFTEALPFYESAAEQALNNTVFMRNFASLLSTLHYHDYAVDVINSVVELIPGDEEVLGLQQTYRKLAQGETAQRLQTQANIIEDAMQSNWNGVINTLQNSGTPSENAGWWFFAAGIAQFFRGNYVDSIACCEKAQTLLGSRSHLVEGCLGIAYQYSKNYNAAISHFMMSYELLKDSDYEDPLPFLGFSMGKDDIEVNLLSALNVQGDYEQCLNLSLGILDLPSPEHGGVTILLFSFIDWTPSMRKYVNSYGHQLVLQDELILPKKKTLFDEAIRVQKSKSKFLNVAYDCMMSSSNPDVIRAHKNASQVITRGIVQDPVSRNQSATMNQSDYKGFVLITQFYFPEDLSMRKSIQDVLVRNLLNDAIEEVYLVCDNEYDFSQLPNSGKITKFLLQGRLRFSDAFRLANERLDGRTVILSNSDVYFDQSLQDLMEKKPLPLDSDLILTLSTWARSGNDSLTLSLRSDSQDSWILTAPISEDIIQQTEFFFGLPRCDNRLAKVFLDSGYRVKNPAFLVHAVEVDNRLREQKYYSKTNEVAGDVVNVPISDSTWL